VVKCNSKNSPEVVIFSTLATGTKFVTFLGSLGGNRNFVGKQIWW